MKALHGLQARAIASRKRAAKPSRAYRERQAAEQAQERKRQRQAAVDARIAADRESERQARAERHRERQAAERRLADLRREIAKDSPKVLAHLDDIAKQKARKEAAIARQSAKRAARYRKEGDA